MRSNLSKIKSKLSQLFGNKAMDLAALEQRVLDNPQTVVDELISEPELDILVERLLARACIRASKSHLLIERLKNNQCYTQDQGVLNFYVRALQIENQWQEIVDLHPYIENTNKSNVLTLMKACLKVKQYEVARNVGENFEFTGEDKVRASFILFQSLVKEAEFNKAIALISQFDFVDNENIFKWHSLTQSELRKLKPYENSWIAFTLARILFKKRRYIEVISLLRVFIGAELPSVLIKNYIYRYYAESLCNVLSQKPLISELQLVLEHARREPCLSTFCHLYQGHLLHVSGNYSAAVAEFNQVEECDYSLPSDKGAVTVRSSDQINNMPHSEHSPIMFEPANQQAVGELVTVVACDSKYFMLFFEIFSQSFKAKNPDDMLHFHIVNPSEEVKHVAADAKSEGKINFSFSKADQATNIKALFASVRFLIAKQLLEYYQKPILITDIDVGFSGRLTDFNLSPANADVCVKFRKDSYLFPWRTIPANTILFNNSTGAFKFLQCFADYFYSVYGDGESTNIWWVDQSALYSIYRYFADQSEVVKFRNLYETDNIDSLLTFHQPFESKQEFINRVFSE